MTNFDTRQLGDLNPENYQNMLEPFDRACADFAERPAFSCLGETLNFAQLHEKSHDFAAYLVSHCGMQAGDRIAIQLPNILQYPIAVWGAWRAGLIVVNTNPLYTPREQIHQFCDADAITLLVYEDLLPITEKILADTPIKMVISSSFDAEKTPATPASSSFGHALALGRELPRVGLTLSLQDLAVLQYTGGTTGPSKGAMLSHGNLYAALEMGRKSILLNPEGADEISLAPLPLYHVFGFTQHISSSVLYGGHSVLIPNPRDLNGFIATMKSIPFRHLNAVNTLLSGLMAHPEFDSVDFSHFKTTVAGGTALVKEIAEEWESRTGAVVYEGYGMSETTSSGFCNRPESKELGTVGLPILRQEIRIIDKQGNALGIEQAGEICLRGPNIMQGYWRRKEATAETIDADGWMKTGDVGILQENGHLRIVDRIKDMILVSGFNVYPNEIEEVVYSHPDIFECAAIGVPDSATGEAVKLFVVSHNPELKSEHIIDYCRSQLAAYKVPKQVVFDDDLPKSPAGKILRRKLRE